MGMVSGLIEGGGRVWGWWEGLGGVRGCLEVLEADGMGWVFVEEVGGWWRMLGGDRG